MDCQNERVILKILISGRWRQPLYREPFFENFLHFSPQHHSLSFLCIVGRNSILKQKIIIRRFLVSCYQYLMLKCKFYSFPYLYYHHNIDLAFNCNLIDVDVFYNPYFLSNYTACIFHFREEMAMKIGLTEARIQVRTKKIYMQNNLQCIKQI